MLRITGQRVRSICCCRDYFNTLEVVCERGPKENYGLLNWTVAEDTDDVVYYQSYTHEVRHSETQGQRVEGRG